MSYVALATDAFDAMIKFYGEDLCFATLSAWDRPNGRGRRFGLDGLTLELLDHRRERNALRLEPASDRFQIVVEVDDIQAARARLKVDAPQPQMQSWGAMLFSLRDPDGIAITFIEWRKDDAP